MGELFWHQYKREDLDRCIVNESLNVSKAGVFMKDAFRAGTTPGAGIAITITFYQPQDSVGTMTTPERSERYLICLRDSFSVSIC